MKLAYLRYIWKTVYFFRGLFTIEMHDYVWILFWIFVTFIGTVALFVLTVRYINFLMQ